MFFPAGALRSAFWWVIHVVIWLNVTYTAAFVFLVALQCVPTGQPWGETCIDESHLLISASVINIISDVAVVVIPLGSIWELQITPQKKRAVWALFAFGTLAPAASVARLVYQVLTLRDANKTVTYLITALLALAEQIIASVAGCVPVISALYLRWRDRNSRSGGHNHSAFQPSGNSESRSVLVRKLSTAVADPYRMPSIDLVDGNTPAVSTPAKANGNGGADATEAWDLQDMATFRDRNLSTDR